MSDLVLSSMKTTPSDAQVVILAGGLGTRLRSVAPHCAKPLVEVGGRPFLLWHLEWLRNQGFCDIVLCIGYRAADFISVLENAAPSGMTIRHSCESVPMGTGGALRLAEPLIYTDAVVVQNGDTYCDFNLAAAVNEHRRSGAGATMVVTKVEDVSRFGSVLSNQDNIITGFHEKSAASGEGNINAGTYVLNREELRRIPPGVRYSLETDLFPSLCGGQFRAHAVAATFLDIGTPQSLSQARRFFAQSVERDNAQIPLQETR